MTTVALHVIAKSNLDDLKRIIQEYQEYVDEIDIAVDDENIINELGNLPVNIYYYPWSEEEEKRGYPNFDDKRNFLVDKCKCDYYLRLDTDDEIVDPTVIKDVLERANAHEIDIVSCHYDYSRDEWGNTHAAHNRETLIRNNGKYRWNKHIHECLIPVIHGSKVAVVVDKTLKIKHLVTPDHSQKSGERNLKFLLDEYAETKDNPDPRTLAYLGRVFYSMGKLVEARHFLEKHISMSGWDEDRYLSWCYMAEVVNDLGDFDQAIACCHEAMNECPHIPDAYLKMLEFYHNHGEWDKGIHWGKIGLALEGNENTFMLQDPAAHTWRPYLSMAYCYLMKGEAEKALQFFTLAKKLVPTHEWVQNNEALFNDAVRFKDYIEKFAWMIQFLKESDKDKIPELFNAIPKELKRHELLVQLRHRYCKPRKHEDNEISIYCGRSWEDWAAPSILKGIGGSEEAVIYMSKELTKLGFKVTVYCSCGDLEGTYEGVTYKDFFEFNPNDDYNTVIAWRGNIFGEIQAKKKIIWLHDVPTGMFSEGEEDTFDRIIVLSDYHKSLLPDFIPAEKVFVSSNGINEKDFRLKDQPERNPYRMIYTSSYDRGIEHLLKMWSEIKEAVPQAELHLFYGWNTYDEMVKKGRQDGQFKKNILPLFNQPGIFEHGRVSHKKLVKEFYKSGIYVYPSHFPEISCISAMKAQACGCVPITTDFAALKETVKSGIKVQGRAGEEGVNETYETKIISVLRDIDYQEALRKRAKPYDFSWASVANTWKEILT